MTCPTDARKGIFMILTDIVLANSAAEARAKEAELNAQGYVVLAHEENGQWTLYLHALANAA